MSQQTRNSRELVKKLGNVANRSINGTVGKENKGSLGEDSGMMVENLSTCSDKVGFIECHKRNLITQMLSKLSFPVN